MRPTRLAPAAALLGALCCWGILTSAQDTTILCNDRLCNDTVVSCTNMSCGYRCGGFAACDHTVFECTEANCSINCDGPVSCNSVTLKLIGPGTTMKVLCSGLGSCQFAIIDAAPGTKKIELLKSNLGTARFLNWEECFAEEGCKNITCTHPDQNACELGDDTGFAERGTTNNMARIIGAFRRERIRADNVVFSMGGTARVLLLHDTVHVTPETKFAAHRAFNSGMLGNTTVVPEVAAYNSNIMEVYTNKTWWEDMIAGRFGAEINSAVASRGVALLPHSEVENSHVTLYVAIVGSATRSLMNTTMWDDFFESQLISEFKDMYMVLFNVPEMCLNVVHYFVEPYVMAFNTSMHDTNNCDPPVPFFGACCIDRKWRTRLTSHIEFPELVMTSTPILVSGSSSMGAVTLSMEGGDLTVESRADYNASILNFVNSSFTSQDLNFYDVTLTGNSFAIGVTANLSFSGHTTFSPGTSPNITVMGCAQLAGDLVVNTPSPLIDNLTLLQTNCQTGSFSSVTVNGNRDDYCLREVPTSRLKQLVIGLCETSPGDHLSAHSLTLSWATFLLAALVGLIYRL